MYREYGQVVAVTNRSLTERPFLEQIRRVCEMHPDALLLREKDLSEKEYEELAKEVMAAMAWAARIPRRPACLPYMKNWRRK